MEENQAREHFNKQGIHSSVGPDGMYPPVLRTLANVMAMPLMIIFGRLWQSESFPRTGREQISLLSLERARKRVQGIQVIVPHLDP